MTNVTLVGMHWHRPLISVRSLVRTSLLALLALELACSDLSGLAGKQQLPAGTLNPNTVKTAAGAMALYQTALAAFEYTNGASSVDSALEFGATQSSTKAGAFTDYVLISGKLTDELQYNCLSNGPVTVIITCSYIRSGASPSVSSALNVDARQLPAGVNQQPDPGTYAELQGVRSGANIAIGALGAYAPGTSHALAGHMYALKGYAEILLADLYCSGVPLSTIDFNGDFTYHAGSTTAQVYRDAIVQFDSAIAFSADSSRILNLARVGQGRAYLDLGLPDSAALAVADVPDGFSYQFPVDWTGGLGVNVANTEGGNGLPYLVAGASDPRVATHPWGANAYGQPLYGPVKYGSSPAVAPVTVADWIEARLIRAEAALADGNTAEWYTQLHYLRQHGAAAVIPDTLPGDTLADPGTAAGRVAVLFRERAYWLFVTGHRQGDLRRLVRQYDLPVESVYPTGAYPPGTAISLYGSDVTLPIPADEYKNPLFTGCLSHGA